MSNKNILFRADSSSSIGLGHIMRDLVLASKFKEANITFATRELSGNINDKIKEKYKLHILKTDKIKELITLIKKQNIDYLIIDYYDISYKDEKKIKNKTKVKILSFDDTYERHYCDILLNHNISADKQKYKNLVPKHCKLLCGSKYTLLRDEFYKARRKKKEKPKNKTVFVAIGGTDSSNINIKILQVLSKFNDIKVNIVTTKANKNLERLVRYCKEKKWINLHINSNKIAKLMVNSDFAIVTPSVTVNEVYFLQIPMIAIKTADNQKDMYKFLKKNGYSVLKKFDKHKLNKKINKLLRMFK